MKLIRSLLSRPFWAVTSLLVLPSALLAGAPFDPNIDTPPASVTITNKGTLTLSVGASGSAPLQYQWLKNNLAIAKATNATYIKTNAAVADAGVYAVRVSNHLNSTVTSDGATVTVDLPIAITKQPLPVTKTNGLTLAKFAVTATGNHLNYQWLKNGDPLPGANTNYYLLPIVTNSLPDYYSVVVTNQSFAVTSSAAAMTALPDMTLPKVTVTTPKLLTGYTEPVAVNAQMGIGGKASDGIQVASVIYRINGGLYAPATLLTGPGKSVLWTNAVTHLVVGANTLEVRAIDFSGNQSLLTTVTFTYNPHSSFALFTNNIPANPTIINIVKPTRNKTLGTNDGSADLQIGRTYRLTAVNTFTNGYIFTNWTFKSLTNTTEMLLETNDLTLDFVMRANMVIYANFITNPFAIHAGSYNGLFYETNRLRLESLGGISVKVSPNLSVSGTLLVDGNQVSFSGKCALNGSFVAVVKRSQFEKPNLTLNLQLDFSHDSLSGTLAGTDWTSLVWAQRTAWTTNSPATKYTNNYTLALPGFTNDAAGPAGFGFGAVTVNTNGQIVLTGTSADRQALKQTAYVGTNGFWPVFIPLYASPRTLTTGKIVKETHGAIIGWLNFTTNSVITNLAPAGSLTWINASTNDVQWPNGFTNASAIMASRYSGGNPLLNWTNGVAAVSGAGISPFTAAVTITNKLAAKMPLTRNFKAALTLKTGLTSGTFYGPPTNQPWLGVLLPDYGLGYGFFTNAAGSGSVILRPTRCGSNLPPALADGAAILFNNAPVVGNAVSVAIGSSPALTFDASAFVDPASCVGNGLQMWHWTLRQGGNVIQTNQSGADTATLVIATNGLGTNVYTLDLTVTGASGLVTQQTLALTLTPPVIVCNAPNDPPEVSINLIVNDVSKPLDNPSPFGNCETEDFGLPGCVIGTSLTGLDANVFDASASLNPRTCSTNGLSFEWTIYFSLYYGGDALVVNGATHFYDPVLTLPIDIMPDLPLEPSTPDSKYWRIRLVVSDTSGTGPSHVTTTWFRFEYLFSNISLAEYYSHF